MPSTQPVGDRPDLSPFAVDEVARWMWTAHVEVHGQFPHIAEDPVLCHCFQDQHQAVRQMLWRGKSLYDAGVEDAGVEGYLKPGVAAELAKEEDQAAIRQFVLGEGDIAERVRAYGEAMRQGRLFGE